MIFKAGSIRMQLIEWDEMVERSADGFEIPRLYALSQISEILKSSRPQCPPFDAFAHAHIDR